MKNCFIVKFCMLSVGLLIVVDIYTYLIDLTMFLRETHESLDFFQGDI